MDLYISETLYNADAAWTALFASIAKFPGYAAAATGIFLAFYALIKKRDPDLLPKAVYLISGVCLTVISVSILKLITDRTRFADLTTTENFYPGRAFGSGGDSFPSGHTAMAACGYLFLPLITGIRAKRFTNFTVTAWVVLTAISRIVSGAHYFTDTVASVLIVLSIKQFLGYFILNKGYLKFKNRIKTKSDAKGGPHIDRPPEMT